MRCSLYRSICVMVIALLALLIACSLSYAEDGQGGLAAGQETASISFSLTAGGLGTKEQPYNIGSYDDLVSLGDAVKGGQSFDGEYFRLTADIELKDGWEPIGALEEGASGAGNGKNIRPFSGDFDGAGFTVTSAEGGKALFGYLRGASVHDLCIAGKNIEGSGLISNYTIDYGPNGSGAGVPTARVTNVTIKSGTSIEGSGFVSGYASMGNTVDITNCTIEQGVVIGSGKDSAKVGSFGGDFNGTIKGCKSAATVYGTDFVGGIIGCKGTSMSDASITGCTFTGEVIASGLYAGGIAGGGYGGTRWGFETAPNGVMLTVQSCLSLGKVTAADIAGGIIGFETTVQPWNESLVRANLFAGKVQTTKGTSSGGIVGAFRGMDKYSTISDNYFADGCGADRGIGKVTYIDTSCKTHETTYCDYYYDTSSGSVPVMEGLNDIYPDNVKLDDKKKGMGNPHFNRTDDPLGQDAEKVAKKVTEEELKDGSVTELLNNAPGSQGNWIQGEQTPIIEGDPVTPIDPEPPEEEKEKEKQAQPMTIKVSGKTYKVSDAKPSAITSKKTYKKAVLKKAAKTFTAYTVRKAEGKVTYKVTGNAKSKKVLKLNRKTGKVTVKKGTGKGAYSLNVKISADGGTDYLAGSKTVIIKVKVK